MCIKAGITMIKPIAERSMQHAPNTQAARAWTGAEGLHSTIRGIAEMQPSQCHPKHGSVTCSPESSCVLACQELVLGS